MDETRSQELKTAESGVCRAMATDRLWIERSFMVEERGVPARCFGGERVCELIVGRRISTCTRPYSRAWYVYRYVFNRSPSKCTAGKVETGGLFWPDSKIQWSSSCILGE